MLEFWIDPASPYAKPIFQEDKKFIFHCAGGLRSALAAKTAQDMGLKPVAHMGGGFAAWRDAGGPIEKWEPKKKARAMPKSRPSAPPMLSRPRKATMSSSSISATPARSSATAAFPARSSCTRGMLEFWIDPASPYAKPVFQEDKKFIFHCAGGMRSALAAKTAQDMGLKPVAHMGGGFAAWRDAGGPVEKWRAEEEEGLMARAARRA